MKYMQCGTGVQRTSHMHAEMQHMSEVYDFMFYYHFCFLKKTFKEYSQASLIH